ncbi:aldehyde dehydrogenase family protein [Geobacillus proteiniphilus]|nr:aldehyde dehydrogenase family protein [Geobacillus proteiniphilus]
MTIDVQVHHFPLFIDGQWQPASSGETFNVYNPATGEVVATVVKATVDDVDRAVKAARKAFDETDWKAMKPKERARVLNAIAQAIAANAQELAYLEAISSGGTIRRISSIDILQVVDLFQTMANIVQEYPFSETLPFRKHCRFRRFPDRRITLFGASRSGFARRSHHGTCRS